MALLGEPQVNSMDRQKPSQPERVNRMRQVVLGPGTEPDPRFSLANERTFLAWLRTSLAMIGGGLALDAFARAGVLSYLFRWVAIVIIAFAALICVSSACRWLNVERAMRQKKPLPMPIMVPFLALSVFAGALIAMKSL